MSTFIGKTQLQLPLLEFQRIVPSNKKFNIEQGKKPLTIGSKRIEITHCVYKLKVKYGTSNITKIGTRQQYKDE